MPPVFRNLCLIIRHLLKTIQFERLLSGYSGAMINPKLLNMQVYASPLLH